MDGMRAGQRELRFSHRRADGKRGEVSGRWGARGNTNPYTGKRGTKKPYRECALTFADFEPLVHRLKTTGITLMRVVSVIFICGLAIWFIRTFCAEADNGGWITHNQDSTVYMDGDWMEGEYRVCSTIQFNPQNNAVILPASRELSCIADAYKTDRPSHMQPVKFNGRLHRESPELLEWKCQRRSDSLKCAAVY
jgi:hypothetical protein